MRRDERVTDEMVELAGILRDSTEAMACLASVDMDLWNRHSNACLQAAAALSIEQTEPVRALERLLDACVREFGWQPDAPEEEPAGNDPDCEVSWGDLHAAHRALAIVDVPAVEPVATGWDLVKGLENGSLALGADMKPYRAHPPVSALVNAQADADAVERMRRALEAAVEWIGIVRGSCGSVEMPSWDNRDPSQIERDTFALIDAALSSLRPAEVGSATTSSDNSKGRVE